MDRVPDSQILEGCAAAVVQAPNDKHANIEPLIATGRQPHHPSWVGRKAGSMPGFAYSNAFRTRANWEWTEDALGGWVMFPSTMVPGTAMGVFQGVAERDRDDLVAYLATLK
jgi:cytochrome c2